MIMVYNMLRCCLEMITWIFGDNDRMNRNKFGKVLYIILFVMSVVLILLGFSIIWCLRTWQHLKMDELIFELTAPLKGTGGDMILKFVINCIVPTVVLTAALIIAHVLIARRASSRIRIFRIAVPVVSAVFALICFGVFWKRLDVTEYIKTTDASSDFIEQNYVDAGKVNLTFPDKERNLIYIFLESVETTYADKANGGGFEENCIPELTRLAEENECFSSDGSLNGGIVFPGTTWTMGGMFAQTSGLPLKIDVGENMMSTQKNFFPGIKVLGDILKDRGYEQVLAIGSDAEFGGRKVYFSNHGDYTFHDINFFKDTGFIPEDYYAAWGMEDEKLFEYARNDLEELAKSDKPFNYTLLTIDTHFEDGYVCRLCKNEFGDDQYANVMACSSRQVTGFVEWIMQQDFYDNTTIVICGDHTTMDSDFCNDVSADYQRKVYTNIINPAVIKTRTDENIQYSTLDMFPTTLAAMGITIEGDRLGLGVNLFSQEKTLVEKCGVETVASELKKGSPFMSAMSGVEITDELMKKQNWSPEADIDIIDYDADTKNATIEVRDIRNMDGVTQVTASLYNSIGLKQSQTDLTMLPDRSYTGEISLKDLNDEKGKITVSAANDEGKEELGTISGTLSYMSHNDILSYMDLLAKRKNIAILIGTREEVIDRTRPEVFKALSDLGVSLKLKGNDGSSFYAVIEKDNTIEEMGEGVLSYTGSFAGDGKEYSVKSDIKKAKGACSIMIDGEEYSTDKRGLNFVIYDTEKHSVVDTASFDISPKYSTPHCVTNVSVEGNTAHITLSKIKGMGDVMRATARIEIWDSAHPEKSIKADLDLQNDGTFTGELDVSSIDINDCHGRVYVTKGKTRVEKITAKWDGALEDLKDYKWFRMTK